MDVNTDALPLPPSLPYFLLVWRPQRFRIFFGLTLGLWAVSVIIASSLSSLSRRYAKALAEKRYSSTYKMTGPYGNGYTAGMV